MTSSGPSSRGGGRGGGGRGGDDRKSWSKDRGANGGRGGGSSNGRRAPKYQAIDIGSRRKARQSRKAEREEERRASARTKEDIFEVGPEGMSVTDLGEMLATSPVEIVKFLFMKGLAVQVNSTLDAETVKLVGLEYGVDVLDKEEERLEESARKAKDFIGTCAWAA